jgi:hypothetical protein
MYACLNETRTKDEYSGRETPSGKRDGEEEGEEGEEGEG